MRRLTFLLPLLWMPGLAHADDLQAVAQRFVAAFQAMHQASSTPADVNRLLALCTDELVYEHARVGAVVRGKSRNPRGLRCPPGRAPRRPDAGGPVRAGAQVRRARGAPDLRGERRERLAPGEPQAAPGARAGRAGTHQAGARRLVTGRHPTPSCPGAGTAGLSANVHSWRATRLADESGPLTLHPHAIDTVSLRGADRMGWHGVAEGRATAVARRSRNVRLRGGRVSERARRRRHAF